MGRNPLLTAWNLWHALGPQWLLFRTWYAVKQRSGWLQRRCPVLPWEAQPLERFLQDARLAVPEAYLSYRCEHSPPFLFSPAQRFQYRPLLAAWDSCTTPPMAYAADMQQGKLRYFEHTLADTGFPPQWHSNPFTGERIPADRHWSHIGDFCHGDIKIVWEPSRFGFVYTLVRAYWRTGDEHYAELFWQCVESWHEHNPPQQGPHWKCGQEISFRVMAWCFGLYGFLDSQATTAARVATLVQMIAVSAWRIAANLRYALSQQNNHGISEGLGLWTIGALFPELRRATEWQILGRQVLETLGQELIYADGAFVQHSLNYQRLMLHDYLWALRLGDLHGQPFSPGLRERVGKAGAFLYQVQDTQSGSVPYYGHNDGSLILPLSTCDYQDFRPVVQAVHYLTTGTRCYPPGPWDEDLLWLFGPAPLQAPLVPPARRDFQADVGGYYTFRSVESFLFTRCATFRHRPAQADMLHVDLWWRGHNLALDAGTYSYHAPSPWDNALSHTAYHNTVTVDGLDQMEQAGRFLWLPWLRGQVHRYQQSPTGPLAYWEGEHDGYTRLPFPVHYRRGIVRLEGDHWLILDALWSAGLHRYRLHWLLPDMPYTWDEEGKHLALQTPAGLYHLQMAALSGQGTYSLVCADACSPRGWRAPYYGHREPALSIAMVEEACVAYFWTLFGPERCQVNVHDATTLRIVAPCWEAALHLRQAAHTPVVTAISLVGMGDVSLKIP